MTNRASAAAEQPPMDLAKRDVAGLPATAPEWTGYESLDPGVFVIPRVSIIQPTSREGTSGHFRMNLTGEEYDRIDVIVIKTERGRVWWPPKGKGGGEDVPLCRSQNFMEPDPAIENPPSKVCAVRDAAAGRSGLRVVCPKATWGATRADRPDCDETFNFLAITADDDHLPFWFSVSGASIDPARRFLSAIGLRRRALWEYRTTISLKLIVAENKYYVIQFSPPERLSAEELAEAAAVVANLRGETMDRAVRAEEAARAEGDAGPAPRDDIPSWMKDKK